MIILGKHNLLHLKQTFSPCSWISPLYNLENQPGGQDTLDMLGWDSSLAAHPQGLPPARCPAAWCLSLLFHEQHSGSRRCGNHVMEVAVRGNVRRKGDTVDRGRGSCVCPAQLARRPERSAGLRDQSWLHQLHVMVEQFQLPRLQIKASNFKLCFVFFWVSKTICLQF